MLGWLSHAQIPRHTCRDLFLTPHQSRRYTPNFGLAKIGIHTTIAWWIFANET